MSEEHTSSGEHSLSADDLAVLNSFDSANIGQPADGTSSSSKHEELSQEDLLTIFSDEMTEDIASIRLALNQVDGDALNEAHFVTIKRVAHKIRGTSGSMNCHAMSHIATYIEEVVEQITSDALLSLIGLNVLVQAVVALEKTLRSLNTQGHESDEPLKALQRELEQFSLAMEPKERKPISSPVEAHGTKEDTLVYQPGQSGPLEQPEQHYPSLPTNISIESQRFERLLRLSEQLAEARTPLENAQEQADSALQELHVAQSRLQQLERTLGDLTATTARHAQNSSSTSSPASSLVEHMLKSETTLETTSHGTHTIHSASPRRRSAAHKDKDVEQWDALEIDRYNERDRTVTELRDAVAIVTFATTRMQRANETLLATTQQYMRRATDMYTHVNQLRIVPLSLLVPHLQHLLETYAPHATFEIVGEKTEVDQDVLDKLIMPLSTLLHTCIIATQDVGNVSEQEHIWLHAQAHGNDVMLEIGFSMAVQGGAFESLQPYLQQIRGTVELSRNARGGVSFMLHFPRSQGTVRGLLVRVGKQRVVLPFSQVQSISDEQSQRVDIVYHLHKLLDFPNEPNTLQRGLPLVVLPKGRSRLTAGVFVDEVLSDITAIVKPLPSYLHRPGITGTILDGKGQLLLLLDLPTLLKNYSVARRSTLPGESGLRTTRTIISQRTVLIADDSLVLRKSLTHVLQQAHYATSEASDGLEALEVLTHNVPDVFLLDMEMPNLNGYDLLSIIHIYPELSDVKIIMLTSRTSEKHKQRALELGAHAYLTKPCPDTLLLETIESVLQ